MFETIDNKNKILGDDIKQEITGGEKVRIAASCFSMYAFNELKDELSKIKELEFIFTSPTFTKENFADNLKKEKREFFIPKHTRENSLYGNEFEIQLRNKMSLKAIAKECANWVKEKVKFKSNITNGNMPNFIGIESGNKNINYMPTGGFTTTDLGYNKGNSLFTAITKSDVFEHSKYLFKMFDEICSDDKKVEDVTQNVIDYIENAYQENSPEFLYYVVLYNIFSEFLDDISEDNMPNEMTGFKNTKLWNMLYDFQKDGVIGIINKLEKHNGCILADSVGLGKTFTALAVILYYSLRNRSVLVLCPKRLADNWNQYCGNKSSNIFYSDRIRYDVLYHTDLGRTGHSNGFDLKEINWGNYDLVVIDESHNFRNNNPVKEKESRYDFLVNHIMKEGVKTKVLMLSATPVNNRYNDLKNQLALAYAQDYQAFEESLDTKSTIPTIFRQAQSVFNAWSKLPPEERTNKELIDNLSIDFKILLDSVTIARSRKNITQYYNVENIGNFPKRRKPVSIIPELTDLENVISYKEIYENIKKLTLSVYAPFEYILDSKKESYEEKFDIKIKGSGLTSKKSHRDAGIKRLMTVNLLKRLESSVESFRLTMNSLLATNKARFDRIERFIQNPDDDSFIFKVVYDYENFDQDEDGSLNPVQVNDGKDVSINLKDMDCLSWKNNIESDMKILQELLQKLYQISPEHDEKLNKLKDLISNKIEHPFNAGNKKILIFSAFADTANYLYKNISPWLKEKYDIVTAKVEGGNTKNQCDYNIGKSTDTILTMFSPISKHRDERFNIDTKITGYRNKWSAWGEDANKDIDCLIATDCISEGQNLQDCDICINYDIHWNPVRIVQRFGRIDRLGSANKEIQLVNFWPTISLDEYIKLSNRIASRMTIVDQTATADDNLLNPDDVIDDYRSVQIKKMQNGEYQDLEESDNGITITDLGLNEFRMDAVTYLKEYGEPTKVPKGLHAVVEKDESKGLVPGVIFILKNYNNNVNINKQNRLHPYYLIYIDDNGNLVHNHLDAKEILDKMRFSCKGRKEPIPAVYKIFNEETDDGLNMTKYNKLLGDGIESIVEVKAETDLMYLFKKGSDILKQQKIKGLDDFELLAFIVVK